MALENVVPALWASRLLVALPKTHVYANAVNRDYEGEIKEMGNTVKITSISDPTIKSYSKNTDIDSPEVLQDAGQILHIDQGKYINIYHDALDKAQAKVNVMDEIMKRSSYKFSDTVDQFLGARIVAGVATGNQLTPATVGRGAGEKSIVDVLVDLDIKLTETDTPRQDRWVIVPPWAEGFLRSSPQFASFGTPENRRTLERGEPIGQCSGFTVYVSNNVPLSGGNPVFTAGYKGAVTYAEQLTETVKYQPEKRFGDALKMLMVYGAKVTRPDNLASIVATRGS